MTCLTRCFLVPSVRRCNVDSGRCRRWVHGETVRLLHARVYRSQLPAEHWSLLLPCQQRGGYQPSVLPISPGLEQLPVCRERWPRGNDVRKLLLRSLHLSRDSVFSKFTLLMKLDVVLAFWINSLAFYTMPAASLLSFMKYYTKFRNTAFNKWSEVNADSHNLCPYFKKVFTCYRRIEGN